MESNNTKKSVKTVITNGSAKIDSKQFIFAFLVLVVAILIPYVVRLIDTIIIFVRGLGSTDKRGSYTFEQVLTQDFNQPMNLAYIMLFTYISYVVVFGLWHKPLTQKKVPAYLKSLFTKPYGYLLIIAGICAQFMVDGFLNFFRELFPDAFVEYDKLVSSAVGPTSSWPMFVAIFLFAPIGEELVFRGLFQGYIKKAVQGSPMVLVIIVQALCFGIYHGNIIQGIYAFFLGLVLGTIAHKAESLIPCIVFHMSVNISVLFVFENWFDSIAKCIIIAIVSSIIFAVTLIAIYKLSRKHQDDTQEA